VLHGRDAERATLAALIDEAAAGRGGALVLHGPPGVGKSALLADAVAHAARMRVLRTQGVESELPLAFAALHRLLRPLRGLVDRLPARQARALRAAFGEEDDPGADRFVIFLAVLGLLAEAAEEAPVLAVIDDAQWLDDASAAALTFAARRVGPEPVGLLFAARDGDVRTFDHADLPTLALAGLTRDGALALLTERAEGLVAAAVAEQLLARTEGNPLALVELPGALSSAQLAGDRPLPDRLPVTDGVRRVFLDRAQRLSPEAQTLLLVVAADDTGDPAAVRSAAALLGVGRDAFDAAEASGLLRVDEGRLELRHPLVRSAVYTAAASRARADAHRALADTPDPDRRAWHLAAATDTPDEQLAAALDAVAERARGRGGQEAAAAALERAAELTPPGDDRRARLVRRRLRPACRPADPAARERAGPMLRRADA
jgi:hypothetical protein